MTFEPTDTERFPGVALGHAALDRGPGAVAALVGADGIAVAAFLAGRLGFQAVVPTLNRCVTEAPRAPTSPARCVPPRWRQPTVWRGP